MNIDAILARLQNVAGAGTDQWTARCPCIANHAHSDKTPSLSIKIDRETEKILLHCHTGCTVEDICAAIGCTVADLNPSKPQRTVKDFLQWYAEQNALKLEAVYSYCYGKFNDGLAKIRFRDSDGKKTFRWLRNDPTTNSGYKLNREGCPHRLYVAGNLADDTVFIVEGEKDADNLHRIMQRTAVSAENGAAKSTGEKWREEYTAQLEGKNVFILYDNDKTGRQFANVEAAALAGHAKTVYVLDLPKAWPECPPKGDISDMIEALGDMDAIRTINTKLIATMEEYTAPTVPDEGQQTEEPADDALPWPQKPPLKLFDDFLQKIQTEAYKPLKTGLPAFDYLLGGGIQKQTIVILTAAPGTGKTAFCSQIFECMAKNGTDVVFLNLEMSREQLLARSISRIAYQRGHKNISAMDVLKGYAWEEPKRTAILDAVNEYRATIAQQMYYNPEGMGTSLSDIMKVLNAAAEDAKKAGRPAPVAVLDYLHLITADKREEQAEVIKKAVAELKDYAIRNDTFVFIISASNRASNSSGTQSLESGRDTSAIEYSADLQLSLNYTALVEKRKKEGTSTDYKANDAEDMAILQRGNADGNREMTVQVLKGRLSAPGSKLHLLFNPAASYFVPVDDYRTPPAYTNRRKQKDEDPYNPFI